MVLKAYRYKNDRKPRFWAIAAMIISFFVTPVSVMAAGDDDYLSALKQEAKKVDSKDGSSTASDATGDAGNAVSREVFEAELKDKYAGSAVFYGKLPASSQEEIFLEYQGGATISELRKKIMDRFLHR
jgi:transcriptional regulator of acetoin/glycerol metabolism